MFGNRQALEDTHTVTVHIKALREKLQDPVKTPHYIQTVWGRAIVLLGSHYEN